MMRLYYKLGAESTEFILSVLMDSKTPPQNSAKAKKLGGVGLIKVSLYVQALLLSLGMMGSNT